MDRWSGILRIPLYPQSKDHYRVAASLCLSPSSKTLTVPSANAIFFNGDRVEGTKNPLIERLSNPEEIAEVLLSKFGGSINAWVVEASTFNGPFAVYKDFIPSVNSWGDPKSYNPTGFPASTSTVSLLSNCLKEAKKLISGRQTEQCQTGLVGSSFNQLKTIVLGFSKGGSVVNQLVTELAFSEAKYTNSPTTVSEEENQGVPTSKESLLNSISEIHYVDVGLNSAGAYLTDHGVIKRISEWVMLREASRIRFVVHGTPRQWCDTRREWIRNEKDRLVQLLESAARRSGGKLDVCERFYYADKPPGLQMHFEIIEDLDVS